MLNKLEILQEHFFEMYPNGFIDEELAKMVKRHSIDKLSTFAQESFSKESFAMPLKICENMQKVVSRSSLVSLFEKPKFKDALSAMSLEQKEMLSIGVYEMLHGSLKSGYEILVELLREYKLAKHSIISLIPYYYAPKKFFFIKPTTTKAIIKYFEFTEVVYKPEPSFEFYSKYSSFLKKIRSKTNKSLSDDNGKFTGFLMMSIK